MGNKNDKKGEKSWWKKGPFDLLETLRHLDLKTFDLWKEMALLNSIVTTYTRMVLESEIPLFTNSTEWY